MSWCMDGQAKPYLKTVPVTVQGNSIQTRIHALRGEGGGLGFLFICFVHFAMISLKNCFFKKIGTVLYHFAFAPFRLCTWKTIGNQFSWLHTKTPS